MGAPRVRIANPCMMQVSSGCWARMGDGLKNERLDVMAGDAERARNPQLELCVSDTILNNLVANATD
ncbi:hypothetical protein GCM10007276_21160 [Agaricicola taiwanensis]|uniref:Uncharacterized protein n=1 Tax=Agaricicola taiwanensis TaxID=591372 RepID=A0A8J2YHX3_9RHOB|nr:hypothetical protein GCM10007276_21160 [Agaricicola taiwanensis]